MSVTAKTFLSMCLSRHFYLVAVSYNGSMLNSHFPVSISSFSNEINLKRQVINNF